MSRSRFPTHLRSHYGMHVSACGNYSTPVVVQRRSIKRVDCLNCLKIIERNEPTKYFQPLPPQKGN